MVTESIEQNPYEWYTNLLTFIFAKSPKFAALLTGQVFSLS